jgi:hypothetical protein
MVAGDRHRHTWQAAATRARGNTMTAARRTNGVRAWSVAAAAVVAAMVCAVLVPMSAQAATVALSGIVDGPTGAPLGGVAVTLINFDGPANTSAAGPPVTSSSSGAFSFPTEPAGDYTLKFGATSTTYEQYFGGGDSTADAESFQLVDAGGNHSFVTAALSGSGTISGKVSKLPSGALAGYTVRAYKQAADGSWSIKRTTISSSTGAYSETGLEPGVYRLEAIDTTTTPSYAPVYSGGTADFSSATSVEVGAGKATAFNFALGKSGSVSGTVTGLDGIPTPNVVEKLAGTRVTVYRLTGTAPTFTLATALDSPSTVTSSTGAYTVAGLAPGNYALEFSPRSAPLPSSGLRYGRTFLGSTSSAIASSYVHIVNGTLLTGRNIQLVAGATVEGEVDQAEDPTIPIPNLRVSIDYLGQNPDDPSEHAQTTITDPITGQYHFDGLGPGSYQLDVGSNVDMNPGDGIAEDTTRLREIVVVPDNPVTSGEDDQFNFTATLKDPDGLNANPSPTIVDFGSTAVGASLSIAPGVWNAPTDQIAYQWLRNGRPIAGATGQSYNLLPGDYNASISATVTATDFEYGSAIVYTNSISPIGVGTMFTEAPDATVTGIPEVGQTLGSTPSGLTVSGAVLAYNWQTSSDGSSWNNISGGASEPTHLITAADLAAGPSIRVEITATKPGYDPIIEFANALDPLSAGTISIVTLPKVTKGATKFTVSQGTWIPTFVHNFLPVTWSIYPGDGGSPALVNVDALPIDSTTTGKYITVSVLHQWAGYTDATTPPILAQTGSAPTVQSGSTAIVGTPKVGAVLTAPSPTWSNPDGTSGYQWQYKSGTAWKNLSGGATATYTPVATDIGRLLRVVTSRRTTGYATATLTSTASAVVAIGAAPANSPVATIIGTVGTNLTVTANPGTWTPAPTKISYQWEYSSTAAGPYSKLSGATMTSYTIPQSLLGKYLFASITATLAGHTTGTTLVSGGPVTANHLTPLAAPKVTHVGTVYTVSGATFSPAAAGVDYYWYVYDSSDSNPTVFNIGPTWDTASSPLYAHVMIIGTAGRPGYVDTTTAPVLAKYGSAVPDPGQVITLDTSSRIGVAIAQSAIGWEVDNPTLTYQWQYNVSGTTWKSISGATSASFIPSASYYLKKLRVLTTASHTDYISSTAVSTATTVDQLGAAPTPGTLANAPGINGYDAIGNTLTAVPGTWSVPGLAFAYQWKSSTDQTTWTAITGATSANFVVPDADFGTTYFQVTITTSKADYTSGTTTLATPTTPTSGQISILTSPKVTSSGGVLTVSSGTSKPAATSYEYYWNVHDPMTDSSTQVSTTNSYTPVAADAGKYIDVTVYPDKLHYNSGGAVVPARTGAKITPLTPITMTGTAQAGSDLTVNGTGWSTIGPFVGIRWYRNGVLIPGFINAATYTQATADIGKTVTARITVSKDGYLGAAYAVTGVGITQNGVTPATTVEPTIGGTPSVDDVLTATTGTWNVSGLSYTFRWNRDGAPIAGATSSSYLLSAADGGEEITVTVTARKTNYVTESVTSEADSIQPGYQILSSLSFATVTGTVGLGDPLTATVGAWICSPVPGAKCPVTITYAWKFQVASAGPWASIPGAVATTYTPSALDGIVSGDSIRFVATASRPGHSSGGLESAILLIP